MPTSKDQQNGMVDDELLLLVLVLKVLEVLNEDVFDNLESALKRDIRKQARLNRSLPVEKKRTTWDVFTSRISQTHFRRMFRMTLSAFTTLCVRICRRIGKDTFKPE
jgi:hypothetical protein